MCCDSHRRQGPNATRYLHPPILNEQGQIQWHDQYTPMVDESIILHATNFTSEDNRCQCRGYDRLAVGNQSDGVEISIAYAEAICICQRMLTEEDLRCDVCRAWCTEDSTPRQSILGGLPVYEALLKRSQESAGVS
jgi:hypothetical protein